AVGDQVSVFVDILGHDVVTAEELLVQPGTTEDGEPDEPDDAGHEQHTGDELADRAASGDAGDEHAHERRPGDPPAPVENGPSGEPAGSALTALVGTDVEGHLHHVTQVDTQGLDQVLEQEDRRAEQQHADQEQAGQGQVDIGQPLDSGAHTTDHGHGGQEGDHHDEDDQECVAGFVHDTHGGHAGGDLLDAQAQGGSDTEERAEHGQDVDDIAHPALDSFTQEGFQRPADRHRPPAAVNRITDGQADDGV